MNEEESIKEYRKRKINNKLWDKVKTLSSGNEENQKEMIEIICSQNRKLPREADELLKETIKEGSLSIKKHLLARVNEKEVNITFGLYMDLLDILANDENIDVRNHAVELLGINPQQFEDFYQKLRKITIPTIPAGFFHLSEQMINTYERIQNITPRRALIDSISTISKLNQSIASSLTSVYSHYYPQNTWDVSDEEIIESETKIIGNELINRLNSITTGVNNFKAYQEICKDIFTFCFVPPLLEPKEEVSTLEGQSRRDLVLHLPYDIDGFWMYLRNRYKFHGITLECKNKKLINQNEIYTTMKYLGPKKLGSFGIIISHLGLDTNAQKVIFEIWKMQDILLLNLTNQNLIDMVKLVMVNQEAEFVIDERLKDFHQSIP